MNPDWKLAEKKVRDITGGKYTPGSGNKHIKGDVSVGDWMIEVKQTSQTILTIQREWFDKLEKFTGCKELCIVLFFQLRGYPYFYVGPSYQHLGCEWKTLSCLESNLPEEITTDKAKWKLGRWEELASLDDLV